MSGERGELDLSIVVPTYNEKENLEELLERIASALDECCKFEVIIVDDNSPDGTWRLARKLAEKKYSFLRVIVRKEERGLATAIIEGMKHARGKYIAVMDADLQHPPETLRKLYEKARETKASLVVASRYARGGGVEGWSKLRLAMSRAASLLAYLLVPETKATSDIMSGFFLVERSLVDGRLEELRPRGYKILLEIIGRLKPSKIVDVPYTFKRRRRGESKLGVKTIVDYVLHVLDLNEWRVAKNAIVGVTGIAVLWALLFLLSDVLGLNSLSAYALALEASILNNFAWNDFWVFKSRRKRGAKSLLERLAKYHVAVALGAVTNYATYFALHGLLGLGKYVSSLAGIALGWLANYAFSEQAVWSPSSGGEETLAINTPL